MRLVLISVSGGARLTCVTAHGLLDGNALLRRDLVRQGYDQATADRLAVQQIPVDIGDFLGAGAPMRARLQALAARVAAMSAGERVALQRERILSSSDDAVYLPPLATEASLFCVGRNYAEHVAEGGGEVPKIPSVFLRLHNSFVGHRQPLVRTKMSEHFDWEVELAVVIGKYGKHVNRAEALDMVAGYTILNEGSVRDYQKAAPHVTAGKNFLWSGSIGPSIVTADEVPDAQALSLKSWVGEQLMQNANTREMVHDIAAQIVYITEFTALKPGDMISTGTPAGVGLRQKPPRWLRAGETLRMAVGNLDPLENSVIDEQG